jgi:DNA-binding PadR family transcriptional regulator
MIEELAHYGYRLSPGTLYPMLHKMQRDGYLTCREERHGRSVRSSTASPIWEESQ